MLSDDPLGSRRESDVSPLPHSYFEAFDSIAADPNNELIVAELGGKAVAVLQLTFIPSLTYRGSWRAQIDGVRVGSSVRSTGIGRTMMKWVIERAEDRGCHLLSSPPTNREAMPSGSTRVSGSLLRTRDSRCGWDKDS